MGNNTYSVEDWNSDLARVLIPNNVILGLYIVFGIVGNSLIIVIYGYRLTKNSEDRYFIPVLAIADLTGSTVCASAGIAANMMQAQFTNTNLCKTFCFFVAYTTYTSVLILMLIAINRYIKVCRPQNQQMTLLHKRLTIGIILCLNVILASPTTVLYGSVDFRKVDGNITGMRCSMLKDSNRIGSLSYGVLMLLICVTCVVLMIYFYGRIGIKLYRHLGNNLTFRNSKIQSTFRKDFTTNESENKSSGQIETSILDVISNDVVISDETEKSSDQQINEELKAANFTTTTKNNSNVNKKNKHAIHSERIMHKFTVIFMLITIIFIICFIPKLILMVMEGLNPGFWQSFSDTKRAGVLFMYRLFILNNVSNQFIYAFMDYAFRREIISLLCVKKKPQLDWKKQ